MARAWGLPALSRNAIILALAFLVCLPTLFARTLNAVAAISSLSLWGLIFVTGALLLRSSQIIDAPGHSWTGVTTWGVGGPTAFVINSLPILVASFQVGQRKGGQLWRVRWGKRWLEGSAWLDWVAWVVPPPTSPGRTVSSSPDLPAVPCQRHLCVL